MMKDTKKQELNQFIHHLHAELVQKFMERPQFSAESMSPVPGWRAYCKYTRRYLLGVCYAIKLLKQPEAYIQARQEREAILDIVREMQENSLRAIMKLDGTARNMARAAHAELKHVEDRIRARNKETQ